MIIDAETNFLYLSDKLEQDYPKFFNELIPLLIKLDIKHDFLQGTKNIWARDYMPIQVSSGKYVQFKYDPGYLDEKRFEHTITDPVPILDKIGISPEFRYDIKLDGGNIVKWKNKAIITEAIYEGNSDIYKKEIEKKIKDYLYVKELILIPPEPEDYTGHADGMVRFLDANTVIVNDYYEEDEVFRKKLKKSFRQHKLTPITFPYYPKDVKNELDDYTALGCYINYLHVGGKIILPTFGISEDEKAIKNAMKILKKYLNVSEIETINCYDVAWNGGVLNCIGWSIKDKSLLKN